jgi:hypothetical protein
MTTTGRLAGWMREHVWRPLLRVCLARLGVLEEIVTPVHLPAPNNLRERSAMSMADQMREEAWSNSTTPRGHLWLAPWPLLKDEQRQIAYRVGQKVARDVVKVMCGEEVNRG